MNLDLIEPWNNKNSKLKTCVQYVVWYNLADYLTYTSE